MNLILRNKQIQTCNLINTIGILRLSHYIRQPYTLEKGLFLFTPSCLSLPLLPRHSHVISAPILSLPWWHRTITSRYYLALLPYISTLIVSHCILSSPHISTLLLTECERKIACHQDRGMRWDGINRATPPRKRRKESADGIEARRAPIQKR